MSSVAEQSHRAVPLPRWAAASLIIGAAMAVDPWGWFPFGPLRWTLISVASLLFVAASLRQQRPIRLERATLLGWGGFLGWGIVASTVALDQIHTWIGTPDRRLGFVTVALMALVFFAGQALAAQQDHQVILHAMTVAVLGIGAYTLLEVIGLAPVDLATASGRPGGPYGSAAYLGAAVALMVPAVVAAAAGGVKSVRWRYAATAAAALGLFASLASQTRAGWVGLVAAAVVSLPATLGWLRRRWPVVVAAAAILLVVVATSPIGGRIRSAVDFTEGTARGRIDEWQVAAAVAVNHPVTGVGFEGYRIAFAEGVDADYERRYTRVTMPDRAHSGPLDVAVATGIPGMAIYLAGAVYLVWVAVAAVRTRRPALVGLGAAGVAYMAQQLFLFPVAEVDPVFWLVAGIVIGAVGRGRRLEWAPPKGAWIGALVLAAAALVAGALNVAADHRAARAADHLVRGDSAAALRAADAAISLRPDSIRYRLLAGAVAAAGETSGGYMVALDRIDGALTISPRDPILLAEHASIALRLAQAERDPRQLRKATAEWEALVARDPVHARYRLELGNAYALGGDGASAETQWLTAAQLAPGSIAPRVNLALLYISADRIEEARAELAAIAAIDPASPELARLRELLDG